MSHLLRSLLARVDALVARVENHEGLVASALSDERERLALAQRELDRVRARAAGLDASWRAAVEEQLAWHERARNEGDELVALRCLRLGKRALARAAELSERCHGQAELQRRLEALVARLTHRLGTLEEQLVLMQNRQADVALARAQQSREPDADNDIKVLLSRWEASVGEPSECLELGLDDDSGTATELGLDEEFLKLELSELRREEP